MKKFISGLIIGAILMCAIPTLAKTGTIQATYNNLKMVINGENVAFANGDEPIIINDRTFVPAKYVAEGLGVDIRWDGKTKTVTIGKGKIDVPVEPIVPTETVADTTPTVPNTDIGEAKDTGRKTSDGLTVYRMNKFTQDYVSISDMGLKYVGIITYGKSANATYGESSCALKRADRTDLIQRLEFINFNSDMYVTLDYYENTMLPLIKAEGN